jgi:hypothetical protein
MASKMVEAYHVHPLSGSHDEYNTVILSNLSIETIRKPQHHPKNALVHLRAAAVNFRSLLIAGSPDYPVNQASHLAQMVLARSKLSDWIRVVHH